MPRLSQSITTDHEELRQFYSSYQSASGSERATFATLFRWKLAIHTVVEELIVYPEIERLISADAAAEDRAQHQTIKVDLEQLERLDESSGEFSELLSKIYTEIDSHFVDEETNDLPLLEEKLTEEESTSIGNRIERSKKFPMMFTSPEMAKQSPFATPSILLSTPLDKARAAFMQMASMSSGQSGANK